MPLNKCLIPVVAGLCSTALLADPLVLPLWDGVAPGSEGATQEEVWVERGKGYVDRSVANVHKPTLTVYLPIAEHASGAAVIIAPGGGYSHLAIDKEGHDIAKWLTAHGVAGLVLKYRLPRTKGHPYPMETPLEDARQAVRLTRKRAAEWGVDPARIGMMGFSAGGNLAARTGTLYETKDARPDFLILGYAAIREELPVDADTPLTFFVHAHDDKTVSSSNSVNFYLKLLEAGVSSELHIYPNGGHGFGIRNRGLAVASWPLRCLEWMRGQKIISNR